MKCGFAMIEKQFFVDGTKDLEHGNPVLRLGRIPIRLLVVIVVGIVEAAIYCTWYLAFYVLCLFRPFTGMMMLAAVVMVPMAIVVFANPGAANGMPFWAFALMAIGLVASAAGYTLLVDSIAPPGAEDPFARYRRRDR